MREGPSDSGDRVCMRLRLRGIRQSLPPGPHSAALTGVACGASPAVPLAQEGQGSKGPPFQASQLHGVGKRLTHRYSATWGSCDALMLVTSSGKEPNGLHKARPFVVLAIGRAVTGRTPCPDHAVSCSSQACPSLNLSQAGGFPPLPP